MRPTFPYKNVFAMQHPQVYSKNCQTNSDILMQAIYCPHMATDLKPL